jgi:tetratricopeptide (TPR) repeat protein
MDQQQALKFLMEDCLFADPLTSRIAEEIWEFHKTIVESLPMQELPSPRMLPLSAADLKAARKFRSWHPEAHSVVDFVRLNPMDLVVHQLWVSTTLADGYRDKVAPDKWLYTALLDPPSDSRMKWRREDHTIIFDLPHAEFFLAGPEQPSLELRVSEAQGFVAVEFHADRALLMSGYHRTFACAQRSRDVANAPRGVLFGVSNYLAAMGNEADDVLGMMESPRPPLMADFFDERLFLAVTLRRRRYQMRVHYELAEVPEEEAQTAPEQSPLSARQPGAGQGPDRRPDGRRDVQGILADAHRHYQAGRLDDAVAHYQRVLMLRPDHANAHSSLGMALREQDRLDDAMTHCERAIALNPDHADAYNNLGNIFKYLGKFDEAIAHYGRATAIRPEYAEAHFNRAETKTFHHGDADLAALEALADKDNLSTSEALYVHFALAKALEDSGDYVRAFEHLRKGNALKRRQINYDENYHLKGFQRISAVFDSPLFDRLRGEGDPSSVPIFVLGMPRSGSTLIEQILASHPQVHGAGELRDLDTAARGVLRGIGLPVQFPEFVPSLDGATLRQIAQAYLARLPSLGDGKIRIVDKSPANYLQIGLIRLILPNARIIHTVRDPIDTCVSCYSKLFTWGQFYSYDLAELGRYYRSYRELMTHWRSVLPSDAMLDVVYEHVVDDLEGQARRLTDYCGLPWDDRCLSFHTTSRPVKTASTVQVRQRLFRSSLQRWRKFEDGLAPLLEELGAIASLRVPVKTQARPT